MSNNCALLARLHRNGTLYLLVPLSFLLIMTTTLGLSRFASVPLGFGISLATPQRLFLAFGSAELVALFLLVPLLFAVLNPSGIARGLASASLGLALSSVGISAISGELRYISSLDSPLLRGIPPDPAFWDCFSSLPE